MRTGRNRIKLFLALLPFLIVLCVPAKAASQQLPAQDVVFLIDSSESTAPYLPAIAGVLSRFVAGARAGDSFACYQFSSNPVLIAKGEIKGQADIAKIQRQLLQLHGGGLNTNYSPALQKGLAEITQLYRRYPEHDRLLIVITDGRSPEDTWSEKANLNALFQTFSDVRSGSEYFFTCFYIGNRVESDLQTFLFSAGARLVYWPEEKQWLERLTLGDVRFAEQEKRLSGILETPSNSSFTLSFVPRRAPLKFTMIELDLEEDLTEQTLDRLFDVRPRRIVCQKEPWSETFTLETRGFTRGSYKGKFLLYPSEPQLLLLYPNSAPFWFSVSEALRVLVPEPLKFGPTGLTGSYEETKSIYIQPSRDDFPENLEAIHVEVDIPLPEGLSLNISPVLRQKEIVIYATVTREEGAPRLEPEEYPGNIKFSSPSGWTLDRYELPVSVNVHKKPINYGRVVLFAGLTAGGIILFALVPLLFSGVRKEIADSLAHKARPAGRLFLLKDPSRGLAKNLNLAKIAEKNKKKSVSVGGSGDSADVEIPHISMVDKAFLFSGVKAGDEIRTLVNAERGADRVLINDIPRVGKVPLKHLDHLKLGAYEFRYEEPLLLQQVVLYYLSGEVQQGWLLDWNASSEGFSFLKREKTDQPAKAHVQFCELKAVAFVRDFDGELTKNLLSLHVPRTGHLARVIFADQEEITGYVFDWKNPGDKFYLFPDAMGENVLFLLIERHTLKEVILLKENSVGAKQARKQFERVLKKMSAEFRTPA